jgi:hypothetical protein
VEALSDKQDKRKKSLIDCTIVLLSTAKLQDMYEMFLGDRVLEGTMAAS